MVVAAAASGDAAKPKTETRDLVVGWTALAAMASVGWWGISAGIDYFSGGKQQPAQAAVAKISHAVAGNSPVDRDTATSSTTQTQTAANASVDFKINGKSAMIQGVALGNGPGSMPVGHETDYHEGGKWHSDDDCQRLQHRR